MNSVPAITLASITNLVVLEPKPIFLTNINHSVSPAVVIKGEPLTGMSDNDAEISIMWTSKIMKNVNNKLVNTKVMTAMEIAAFQKRVQFFYPPQSNARALSRDNYRWVKMLYVPGLSDATMLDNQTGKYTPQGPKKVLSKMLRETFWEDLGMIVAADIFNGNNDRFYFQAQHNTQIENIIIQWGNQGNIMFLSEGTTYVIGLDAMDPSGQGDVSNLGTNVSAEHASVLAVLKASNHYKRHAFSSACVTAIAKEIKKMMNDTGAGKITMMAQGFDGPYVVTITADGVANTASVEQALAPFSASFTVGLNRGINRLRAYLKNKRSGYNVGGRAFPAGIQNRMQLLDW